METVEIQWKAFGKEFPNLFPELNSEFNKLKTLKKMQNTLLIKAFEKASREAHTEKVLPRAQLLSDVILEHTKEPYGEKILRIKYNEIQKQGAQIRLKKHAQDGLCAYLGYDDYTQFINANSTTKVAVPKQSSFWDRHKVVLVLVLIILSIVLIYNYSTRQRWMVWQDDHYVEVDFNLETYSINQLKVYKEERVDFFKKITPHCNYNFFNADGSVNVWYRKNKNKTLDCFSALGLHPETGKTLKPITQYMIDKYICKKN